jgi:preprotein translocase subunit SecG
MAIFSSFLMIVQVLSALAVIVLVLLQHGKGADMGAAFGSGSSGSLFGATGAANFLSRTTAVCATIFFLCTLGLSFTSQSKTAKKEGSSVMEGVSQPVTSEVPAPQGVVPKSGGPVQDIPK